MDNHRTTGAVWRDVDGAVDRALREAVFQAVTGSVHPGLRDFIDEVGMSK